jgi:two-component system cell cycle sensor histidine kinase/response regulator CckA
MKDADDRLAGRFERIVQECPDIIGVIDREFRHVFVNRAVERTAGIAAADFLGKTHDELGLPSELVARFQAVYAEVFETGVEGRKTFEYPSPDGTVRYYESRVVPLVEEDGRVDLLLSYGRDVTEERAQQALSKKLQETQRLESLGLLAGGIAHDFNNLLASILGTAAVARKARDPGSIEEALEQIEASCMQAADLCRQMLAYAGRGQSRREPLDIDEVLRMTHELVAPSVSKDLAFEIDVADGLPTVEGDRSQLQQVLMNLLLNAADASDESGRVTIRVRAVDGAAIDWSDAYRAPDLVEGPLVELTVRDRGQGMDADTLARIFEPFFTTKFTGRGLGLAATLGILETHRAGLFVESAPGEGTCFRLYFRACREPSRPGPAAPEHASGPLRILLVDDEELVRRATGNMLGLLGHEVTGRADAADALATHASADPPFDLVVLDLTMPGMDGAEALERLRAKNPALPVILMSGYSKADVATHVAEPATAFLQKPFRLADLERALASVGE